MLLQNTLDLSTFEIVRFRIWNQTSHPDDKGVGTKYFNTNSGHEGYNRENIYTATGWRRTAYMDDIEAITNGEGSLGTRVKALEDMLSVDDANDVINTWAEIQAFLDQVQEGTDLMTMLDGKAEWAERIPDLSFKHIGYGYAGQGFWTSGPALSFGANANYFGQIQMDIMPVPTIKIRSYNKGYGEWQTLLHSGNVGEYAILVTSNQWATSAVFSGDVGRAHIVYRGNADWGVTDDGWSNEYSIIHQGNVGDYTAGAAKKLVKSTGTEIVTIDDNGTTNFAGGVAIAKNVTFNPTNGITWRIAETNITNVTTGSTGNFVLGNGGAAKGYKTYLDGGTLYFRTYKDGASQTAMTITEEGNVEIAGANNAYTRKLAVGVGGAHIITTTTGLPSLGTPDTNTLLIGSVHYGLQIGTNTNDGASHIQAMRFDGTATAYALNLNPLGGAVNVGGNLAPNANNSLSLGTSSYRWSNVYSVGGDFSNYINLSDDIGSISYKDSPFIRFEVNDVYIGTSAHAPSLTLGSKSIISFRTGDGLTTVASITKDKSTFSNRVLIGGAEDDADYALNVKGVMNASAIKTPTIYIECAEDGTYGANGGEINRFNGTIHMQYASQKDITLCYGGGNVGIGVRYPQHKLDVLGDSYFDGTVYIPTGQTLTIGSVTFKEVATGEIEVDGNLHTTGTLASGGKAEEGENTTGNAMVYQYDLASGESVYTVDNVKGSTNVIVQIFEWNGNTSSWDMILTDVSVKADAITVTFGRTTTVNHMVTVC